MEILATCHVHSKWSYDATWTLEALATKFSRRGSRVLMMTEHDRGFTQSRLDDYRAACVQASSGEILVVPGIEYSDGANRVHVLVWGPVPFLGESLPTSEMLECVRSAGGLAVLAHPSRRDAWKGFDSYWGERLLGIEAWNRKYDGWAPSNTAPSLISAANAVPFVGLDFHTDRQSFPLSMALEMTEPITEQSVLNCMMSRRCSPRAFGLPLDEQGLVHRAVPVLKMAERSRRMAASIVKRSHSAKPSVAAKQQ
jgi:hypothetical protein